MSTVVSYIPLLLDDNIYCLAIFHTFYNIVSLTKVIAYTSTIFDHILKTYSNILYVKCLVYFGYITNYALLFYCTAPTSKPTVLTTMLPISATKSPTAIPSVAPSGTNSYYALPTV